MRGNRGNVHNTAGAALLHSVDHCARNIHQAVHVGSPHAFHLGIIEIAQIAAAHGSGIVNQNIYRSQFLFHSPDHGEDGGSVAHVGLQSKRLSALLPDFRG